MAFIPLDGPGLQRPGGVLGNRAATMFGSLGSGGGGGSGTVVFQVDAENGTNGAQDATDVSPSARPITWRTNANVTTATAAQGTKSINCSALYAYISTTNMVFTGDFTVELEVRLNFTESSFTNPFITCLDFSEPGSWQLRFDRNPNNFLQCRYEGVGGSDELLSGSTDIVEKVWYHVALTRQGNTLRLFLDGVLQNSADVTGIPTFGGDGATLLMGNGGTGTFTSQNLACWLDMIRITDGLARYTANFTPPTSFD